MILGRPVFDASAPLLRVRGRRISNAWTNLETLGAGIDDSLYGFRVYPIAPLLAVMRGQRWMRRFDFDTEAVVRLAWRGVTPINIAAPVKYLRADEGGVSHFRYGRDNVLLTWMHLRLMLGFALRLPLLGGAAAGARLRSAPSKRVGGRACRRRPMGAKIRSCDRCRTKPGRVHDSNRSIVVVAAVLATSLSSSVAFAQASSPSRAAVKADTRAAEKAGKRRRAGEAANPTIAPLPGRRRRAPSARRPPSRRARRGR